MYNYNLLGTQPPPDRYYLSPYGIAVKNGFEGTEEEWLASLGDIGPQGPEGPAGADGVSPTLSATKTGTTTSIYYTDADHPSSTLLATVSDGEPGSDFQIKGYYATLAALQAAVTDPAAGDAYGVGASDPYDIYIYDGVNETWVDNGNIQGPAGSDGVSPTLSASKVGKVTSIYYTDADHPTTTLLAQINDGEGAGDMLKNTYDTNNVGTDIYTYAAGQASSAVTTAGTNADTKIQTALNRASAVNAAYTGDYSSGIVQTYVARGEAFATSDTTPSVNGCICWTVE